MRKLIINSLAFSSALVLLSFISVASKDIELDASKLDAMLAFIFVAGVLICISAVLYFINKLFFKGSHSNLSKVNTLYTVFVLTLLLITVFFPSQFGELDGGNKDISYNFLDIIKDNWRYLLALLIACAIVKYFKSILSHISLGITCFTLLAVAFIPLAERPGQNDERFIPVEDFKIFSKNKNIIFIVFDATPGTVLESIFANDSELRTSFKDFIFYPHTISPSIKTSIAIPSIVSGISALEPFNEHEKLFERVKNDNIVNDAKAHEYETNIFLERPYYLPHWGNNDAYNTSLFKEHRSISDTVYYVLDNCLLRILPVQLNQGTPTKTEVEMLLTQYPFKISSNIFYKELIKNADINEQKQTFTGIHLLLSHGPYLYTEDGGLTENGSIFYDNIYTMHLTKRLLLRLKEIGVYDNSLIIFCSDHGRSMPINDLEKLDPQVANFLNQSGNSYATIVNYNSFVMIKYPGHVQEELTINFDNVASVNLYSVLKAFITANDWTDNSLDGIFARQDIPMGVRVLHKDNYKERNDQYDFSLLQSFPAPDGLYSLPQVFEDLTPVKK